MSKKVGRPKGPEKITTVRYSTYGALLGARPIFTQGKRQQREAVLRHIDAQADLNEAQKARLRLLPADEVGFAIVDMRGIRGRAAGMEDLQSKINYLRNVERVPVRARRMPMNVAVAERPIIERMGMAQPVIRRARQEKIIIPDIPQAAPVMAPQRGDANIADYYNVLKDADDVYEGVGEIMRGEFIGNNNNRAPTKNELSELIRQYGVRRYQLDSRKGFANLASTRRAGARRFKGKYEETYSAPSYNSSYLARVCQPPRLPYLCNGVPSTRQYAPTRKGGLKTVLNWTGIPR